MVAIEPHQTLMSCHICHKGVPVDRPEACGHSWHATCESDLPSGGQSNLKSSQCRVCVDVSRPLHRTRCHYFSSNQSTVVANSDDPITFSEWAWSSKTSIPIRRIIWLSANSHEGDDAHITDLFMKATDKVDVKRLKMIHLDPRALQKGIFTTEPFIGLSPRQKAACYDYCMNALGQRAAVRGIQYLEQLCSKITWKRRSTSGDTETARTETCPLHFYGAEISFLVANLLNYVDTSSSELIKSARSTASKLLLEWEKGYSYERSEKYLGASRNSHPFDTTNEYFALVEAMHANNILNVLPESSAAAHLHCLRNSKARSEVVADLRHDLLSIRQGVRMKICGHCGSTLPSQARTVVDANSNGSDTFSTTTTTIHHCPDCGHRLPPSRRFRPFSMMTDAIIWLFLLRELRIPLCDQKGHPAQDLELNFVCRQMLAIARPYQSEVEIGREDFKLQLYFVAHLILVITKFGRFRVPVDPLGAEFLLILTSLPLATHCFNDTELAGELLHVLKLFRLPRPGSQEYILLESRWLGLFPSGELKCVVAETVASTTAFLLSSERSKRGVWFPPRPSGRGDVYDAFHGTYCNILGLALKRRSASSLHDDSITNQNDTRPDCEELVNSPPTTGPLESALVPSNYITSNLLKLANDDDVTEPDHSSPHPTTTTNGGGFDSPHSHLSSPPSPSIPFHVSGSPNDDGPIQTTERNKARLTIGAIRSFRLTGSWPDGVPRLRVKSLLSSSFGADKSKGRSSSKILTLYNPFEAPETSVNAEERYLISVQDIAISLGVDELFDFVVACAVISGHVILGLEVTSGAALPLISPQDLHYLLYVLTKTGHTTPLFPLKGIRRHAILRLVEQLNLVTKDFLQEYEDQDKSRPTVHVPLRRSESTAQGSSKSRSAGHTSLLHPSHARSADSITQEKPRKKGRMKCRRKRRRTSSLTRSATRSVDSVELSFSPRLAVKTSCRPEPSMGPCPPGEGGSPIVARPITPADVNYLRSIDEWTMQDQGARHLNNNKNK